MTPEEQEILDILSNRIYVIVEYDDSAAREYLRHASALDIEENIIKSICNSKWSSLCRLKVISDRLTWDDALCFHLGRNKCFIADYRNHKHPLKL